MDIINHLTRTVTPVVLGDNPNNESKNLLEQFYALFAAKLADNETYNSFSEQDIARDDNSFFDRVWTDENHRNSISRELASNNNIDEATAKGLVASAAPLTLHELKSLAGTTPVPQFLRDNLSTYQKHIPTWASTVLPAGVLASGAATHAAGERISDTVSTAPLQHTEKENGSFMKALLPIIGLIILGALAWALLRGCQDNTQPVATPVETAEPVATTEPTEEVIPVATVEPATLALATGEGNQLYACRAGVGSDSLGNTITSAVRDVFGDEADKCMIDSDDNFDIEMPAAEYLSAILPILKASPHANAIIEGNEILVNSPDEAGLQQLVADLQAAAPNMQVTAEGPLDIQGAVDASIVKANTAMDALGDNPDPRDVARVLSRQIINFEFDESSIPDVNKPLLDRAAEIMQKTPDMELLIIGHTDAIDTNDYNIPLSQRRAQSVKDYLVSKGAYANRLKIQGMGESDPIATNETEQGRFRNRRIEYVVYDESMGAADENGIVVAPDSRIRETEVKNKGNNTGSTAAVMDPDLNPLDNNNDDILPDGDDTLLTTDPDLNPLDNNNDDILPDSDDVLLDADPDLNPLDNNNDDILPDSDDTVIAQ